MKDINFLLASFLMNYVYYRNLAFCPIFKKFKYFIQIIKFLPSVNIKKSILPQEILNLKKNLEYQISCILF